MTIYFPNIRTFQDHFILHETLHIPPDHHLCIRDIHAFTRIRKNALEIDEPEFECKTTYILNQLNKFISPLGKTLLFDLPEQDITYTEDPFEVKFPNGVLFTAKKAIQIFMRTSELFSLMIISSRMSLKLQMGQELYLIGLKKEALERENLVKDILEADPLSGFSKNFCIHETNLVIGTRVIEGSSQEQNFLSLKPATQEGSIEFSFTDIFEYSYYEDCFIERMLLRPLLHVPPNATLKITGPVIFELGKIWNAKFKDKKIHPILFALNQLLLVSGKNVSINIETCRASYRGDTLEIYSDTQFTIELIDKGIRFLDLRFLAENMIRRRVTYITIPANEEIFFYDLTAKEKENFSKLIHLEETSKLIERLKEFFMSRLPVGFDWSLNLNNHLIIEASPEESTLDGFWLSSESKIKISLVRPKDASIFALSILQNCNPGLATALLEYEVSAFLNILFKSVFYFCCSNFRFFYNKKIPNYFKKETKSEIQKTLKDKIFTEHLEKIGSDKNLTERLNAFNLATPQEFDQKEQDENESIAFVVNRIKTIAAIELQGSDYLQNALQAVIQYLEAAE